MKKKFLLIFTILIIFILSSCNAVSEYKGRTLFYFDTTINITFYNTSESDRHYDNIKEMIKEISNVSSNFKSYDNKSVYDLNNKKCINKNEILEEMLKYAFIAKEKTNGYFEPLIGNLASLWKDAIESKVIPSEDKITLELENIKSSEVVFTDSEIKIVGNATLDLGGFIKGYACYKVKEYLDKNNITNYIINMGESNIIIGEKVGSNFSFGLKKPLTEGYYAEGVGKNLSIATSSVEYQNFIINDTRYHHIISPFTGYPVNYYESVNVIGNEILYSDSLSTAIFLMDKDTAISYAKKNNINIILYKENVLYKSEELDYVKTL